MQKLHRPKPHRDTPISPPSEEVKTIIYDFILSVNLGNIYSGHIINDIDYIKDNLSEIKIWYNTDSDLRKLLANMFANEKVDVPMEQIVPNIYIVPTSVNAPGKKSSKKSSEKSSKKSSEKSSEKSDEESSKIARGKINIYPWELMFLKPVSELDEISMYMLFTFHVKLNRYSLQGENVIFCPFSNFKITWKLSKFKLEYDFNKNLFKDSGEIRCDTFSQLSNLQTNNDINYDIITHFLRFIDTDDISYTEDSNNLIIQLQYGHIQTLTSPSLYLSYIYNALDLAPTNNKLLTDSIKLSKSYIHILINKEYALKIIKFTTDITNNKKFLKKKFLHYYIHILSYLIYYFPEFKGIFEQLLGSIDISKLYTLDEIKKQPMDDTTRLILFKTLLHVTLVKEQNNPAIGDLVKQNNPAIGDLVKQIKLFKSHNIDNILDKDQNQNQMNVSTYYKIQEPGESSVSYMMGWWSTPSRINKSFSMGNIIYHDILYQYYMYYIKIDLDLDTVYNDDIRQNVIPIESIIDGAVKATVIENVYYDPKTYVIYIPHNSMFKQADGPQLSIVKNDVKGEYAVYSTGLYPYHKFITLKSITYNTIIYTNETPDELYFFEGKYMLDMIHFTLDMPINIITDNEVKYYEIDMHLFNNFTKNVATPVKTYGLLSEGDVLIINKLQIIMYMDRDVINVKITYKSQI